MNQHAGNTSEVRAEQVASTKCQTLKLGLDVHADSIVVVRILDHSAPQPAQKLSPHRFLHWAKTQLGLAQSVHSCYEAGPFGYGLHRQLVELGIQNVVVQPVCLDERHKGVNHDKSDARALAMRLDRYVAGNTHALGIVRVPSIEQEQLRAQSRQREQLRRQLQRVASQGRSLLLSQGFRERKTWWEPRRWEGLQPHLAPWLMERLEVFRRVLETLEKELTALSQALETAARPMRPKGLGAMTCEIIEREIGDWNRFNNRRQVSSYTGLCGGLSSSGRTTYHLSITKHGNARVRTALVELAWRLVRWQRDCKLVKKWWGILGNPRATKGAKKKAIVAVARQAAVDLWRWHTGRVSPGELGWVMIDP